VLYHSSPLSEGVLPRTLVPALGGGRGQRLLQGGDWQLRLFERSKEDTVLHADQTLHQHRVEGDDEDWMFSNEGHWKELRVHYSSLQGEGESG